MLKVKLLACLFIFSFFIGLNPSSGLAAQARPKLLLVLVIDQFRADYLSRFEKQFLPKQTKGGWGGFQYLKTHSAYFPLGQYDTLQNITAPGHATILTGAYPYQSGIPMNEWFDAERKQETYCTEDQQSLLIDSTGVRTNPNAGRSPKNLMATTVGDELKNESYPARVISVALKDRAAILLGGHRADLALWHDMNKGEWISSQHYLPEGKLPLWVDHLNATFKNRARNPNEYASPYGVEVTLEAAEKAFEEYQLGRGKATDILAVSFSSHDMVGHSFGPNSPQIEEMTLAEDKAVSKLLNFIHKKVPGGLKNVVTVFTADHGVSPSPDWAAENKINAQRVDTKEIAKSISNHLNQKFGKPSQGGWILYTTSFNFYLNHSAIKEHKLEISTVEAEIKKILASDSRFTFVITATDLASGRMPPGIYNLQAQHTHNRARSGDFILVPKPYHIPGNASSPKGSTTHVTGYSYDRTIPIIISGFHIKPGVYATRAEVVDIAPTLSFLAGILPPSLSEGRVLSEIIDTKGLYE